MKHLLILGGGTAGTIAANKLHRKLDKAEWSITVVDQDDKHHYQPGFLFIPFGMYTPGRGHQVAPGVPRTTTSRSSTARSTGSTPTTGRAPRRRARARRTTSSSSRRASTPARTRPPASTTPTSGRRRCSTSTPTRARPPWRRSSRRGRAAGSRSASSTCPSSARWHRWSSRSSPTSFFTEQAHARPGRDRLRDPARRRVHQAGRREALRRDARRPQDRARARLHDRADRRRPAHAGLVRRARGRVRPAGDGAAQHGRGLRGAARAWATSSTRAGRQAHAAVEEARATIFALGDANDIPTSKAGSVAHFSIDVFIDNFLEHIAGQADDRLLRRARQLLHRDRPRQGACSSTSTTTPSRCRASTRCPASAR